MSTPSLPRTVSRRPGGKKGISQSTVPILEVPSGTAITTSDEDIAPIDRSVDHSGQENDGDGESTVEGHCVER